MMLSICALLVERWMPTERAGTEAVTALHRDAMTMWRVFETFVANFLKRHLKGWRVTSQPTLYWTSDVTSPLLPVMKPDIILENGKLGVRIVLDTKFYKSALAQAPYGQPRFHQANLYQMYAYLRSQSSISGMASEAAGLLLYPTASHSISEQVRLDGHWILWETLDLSVDWPLVENALLGIIDRASRTAASATAS
jgi:5-methylcytosine-specific restriction enzyme subunit McrC